MTTGAGDYYDLTDALGSVANLTAADGSSEWSHTYKPFGAMSQETQHDPGAPQNPMRYTGQLSDPDTGLYHLRARQYDPALGRFLTLDPLEQPLTDPYQSAYLYANGMPTALVDPSGLDSDAPGGESCGLWAEKIPFFGDEWCEGFKTLSPTWQGVVGATLTAGPPALAVAIPAAGAFRIASARAAQTTLHGAQRLAERGFTQEIVALTRTGRVLRQADGATVYLKEVAPGRFNVLIVGNRGVITGMRNLPTSAVDRLARNYRWEGHP